LPPAEIVCPKRGEITSILVPFGNLLPCSFVALGLRFFDGGGVQTLEISSENALSE
jgi:hypothetical protein